MMYAPAHFPSSSLTYREIYYNINSIFLWFHMPLFIFISGYLFSHLYTRKGKYRVFWGRRGFLLNKLKRLILPFIMFSLIFGASVGDIPIQGILTGTYSHLWFLSMLFWCFILVYTLYRMRIYENSVLSYILLIIFFSSMFLPYSPIRFLGIHYLPRWFFWFWLGCIIQRQGSLLLETTYIKHILLIILPVIYLASEHLQIYYVGSYGEGDPHFFAEIGFLAAVVFIWLCVNVCIQRFGAAWTEKRLFVELGSCSFGIYIFHNWLEPFMISRTAQSIFPLAEWARDHVILFPLCFSLAALICSYVLTKLCLMTKVGRMLLG